MTINTAIVPRGESLTIPDIETFLGWTNEQVAEVAPKTVVYAPAGTRRRALLDGVQSADYSTWAIQELAESVKILFEHGVKHVIVPTLGPGQLEDPHKEYSSQIVDWIVRQATSETLQSIANKSHYRIRLIGPATRNNRLLCNAAIQLKNRHQDPNHPIMWMYVVQSYDDPWIEVIETISNYKVTNRAGLVRMLYDEDIPPVSLYIGFGRFAIHNRIIPLILFDDDIQCYWTTKAGFRISKTAIRKIIYDAVYSRSKENIEQDRYDYVDFLRGDWNREIIMGLGSNIHGFWFPKTDMET